jgi:hypothetical protein
MRRIIPALVLGLSACTTPDGGDFRDVREAMRTMSPEDRVKAKTFEANRRAEEDLSEDDPDDTVGKVMCVEDGIHISRTVKVDDILTCLRASHEETYTSCLKPFADWVWRGHRGPDVPRPQGGHGGVGFNDRTCWWEFEEGFDPADRDNRHWSPDAISDDDLARSLIASQSPPAWVWGTLLVVVGGTIIALNPELFPVLCLLAEGDHWSCPDSPLYPPGQTPDRGDR